MAKVMMGTRVTESARERIKLIARAPGMAEGDALSHIVENYECSPALERAIAALAESDKAVSALKASILPREAQ